MRIATEITEGLQYRLRMMGIPIDGSASVFCDNMSVVMNTTHPESMLKKKHNAIAYHRVHETIAAGIILHHRGAYRNKSGRHANKATTWATVV